MTPVSGVRPGDAQTFCEWLTEREPGEWGYRLPEDNELNTGTGNEGVGYWTKTKTGDVVLAGATAPAKTVEVLEVFLLMV